MYVPGFTRVSERLYRRKGGGGGGKSGKGGSGGDSSGGGGKSGGDDDGGVSEPLSGSTAGRSGRTVTPYGSGGGKPFTIASDQQFAGRTAGGGTRSEVYGTKTYGSGYPGVNSRGVSGLGFPFIFWPVVWGGGLGYGAAYLHDTNEYGQPDNSSRPGGPMTETTFTDSNSNNTFHLLADNETVIALIGSVSNNCSLGNASALVPPIPVNSSDPTSPRPEQAVQYYRASSVVLTLDGYNNTAALLNDSSIPDTPLPSWVDQPFLDCLNQTIGASVPLVDGVLPFGLHLTSPSMGLLAVGWLMVFFHLTF